MNVARKKELLHLRIEQADEHILDVLSEMAEVLFKNYQPGKNNSEASMTDVEFVAAYEANLKPMTVDELVERAKASEEDIAAGRIYTIDEVKAELQL